MGQMDTNGGVLWDFLGYSWHMNGRYEVCIKVFFSNNVGFKQQSWIINGELMDNYWIIIDLPFDVIKHG